MDIRSIIIHKELDKLKQALEQHPELVNAGLSLDEQNPSEAHPLHRICDGVFNGMYSDNEAVEIATLFLDYGAKVDGNEQIEGEDTPLVAAASLLAEKVGILYIDRGADIHHPGCYGGTALHWAAWCGLDKLVQRLLQEGAAINRRCTTFKGTPLLWAVHGYVNGDKKNRAGQIACVRLLLEAGADKTIPNVEGYTALEFLSEQDEELIQLLKIRKLILKEPIRQ